MSIDPRNLKHVSAQLLHWEMAIDRLAKLDEIAAPEAWGQLERETNSVLRASIQKTIRTLKRNAAEVRAELGQVSQQRTHRAIHALRRDYLRTETVLDFFADAINSRSSTHTGRMLRGLDEIAGRCMRDVLEPLGYSSVPVICYIDKGLGASILKAGLRLWDRRSTSIVASIKVVRHNTLTCTSVLHECGHQIAHIIEWNQELRRALNQGLPRPINRVWAMWASEIAADAVAFCQAGHASIAALRNVVDGGDQRVFRFVPGDPHPIGAVRLLMNAQFAMSTIPRSSGSGQDDPWNDLARAWIAKYPLSRADKEVAALIRQSIPYLPTIAEITLIKRYKAFRGKSLVSLLDPRRISPTALSRFEQAAGPRAFELPYIVRKDPIRLLALSGLRIATDPDNGRAYYRKQQSALHALGTRELAA